METLDKIKTNGPDDISTWKLHECAKELNTPLHILSTYSLNQGRVLNLCRRANVIPLFKQRNKKDPLSYRPVSLKSVVCKLLDE